MHTQPNYYGRWHTARKAFVKIQSTLNTGGVVMVATYTKATQYDKLSHSALFKATPNGLYALHGKKWVCIDGCSIKFYTVGRK